MATWPPHGLTNWDDDLLTWMRVAHQDDGTQLADDVAIVDSGGYYAATTVEDALAELGAGGGTPTGLVQPWTYFCTSNGTTITVYNNAGAIVTTGADLGALFNARVAARQIWQFGTGDFPVTTALTVPDETYSSIILRGAGGLTNENIQNLNILNGATRFAFSPSTGTCIRVNKAQAVHLEDIHIQATHNSYTGSLVDFRGDYTTNPRKVTRHCGMTRCFLHTRKGDTTGALLELSTVVDFVVHHCLFRGGRWNIRGMTDSASVALGEPSDEVHFNACRFQYYQSAYGAIGNAGRSWSFDGCTFETAADGSFGVFMKQATGVPGEAISVNDCYSSDYTNNDGVDNALFTWNGDGLAIRNMYCTLPSNQRLIYFNGDSSGIYVSGLFFNSSPPTTDLMAIGSGSVRDIVVEANGFANVTTPIISGTPGSTPIIRGVAKTSTITASATPSLSVDLVLANATSGSLVVTLPAVGTRDHRLTVKKTDATANTVTLDTPGSETIDGSATKVISAQWGYYTIESNGTNWYVIASG